MKKIKRFLLAAALAAALTVSGLTGVFGWIGDRYENEETAFTSVMNEMRDEQGFDYNGYTFEKAALYDTNGNLSGYCYDFTLDGLQDGFILMVKVDAAGETFYEVTEIFPESKSPFYGNAGVNIYPTFTKYITFVDGCYYNLLTGYEISAENVLAMEELGFGFSEISSVTVWDETVNYATRTITKDEIAIGIPGLNISPTLGGNGCVPIAGSNIIGYWAYYKPNLLANITIAYQYGGAFFWNILTPVAQTLSNELYVRMGTNTTGPGTTIAQFKSGIQSYANAFGGYSVTFTSAMTSGQYDMSKLLAAFAAGKPVALFMSPEYNFVSFIRTYTGANGTYDVLGNKEYESNHTMVACGRHIYTWFNSSGAIVRQITYLRAVACNSDYGMGWIRLNEGFLSVDEALSVEIT